MKRFMILAAILVAANISSAANRDKETKNEDSRPDMNSSSGPTTADHSPQAQLKGSSGDKKNAKSDRHGMIQGKTSAPAGTTEKSAGSETK